MSQSPRQNGDSLSGLPPVDTAGFERLFGDSTGLFGMDGQLGVMGESAKDPAESLFENTLKAFCCMAGGGEGGEQDRPPMQVRFFLVVEFFIDCRTYRRFSRDQAVVCRE